MKKMLVIFSAAALLSACSHFKPDYVVVDASSEDGMPKWTQQEKAHKVDSSSEAKDFRYYTDEAENVNKRLCVQSARVRATQKIASEIAQEIVSKFEEKSQSENDAAESAMKEKIEQNIKVTLNGVIEAAKYWEKRSHKMELGADKDLTNFHCNSVVKISKTALADALAAYKAKALKTLQGEDKAAMAAAVDEVIANVKSGEVAE